MSYSDKFAGTPSRIALSYVVFGVTWIVTTDSLVFVVTDDSQRMTQFQTAKGWIFVVLSSGVIYGLVSSGQRKLTKTHDELDRALQQTSILHRILRHNLRNACNIIRANAEMLSEDVPRDNQEYVERIEKHNERLITLSEKSRQLRNIVLTEEPETDTYDVVALIERQINTIQQEHPGTTVETDLPAALEVDTDPRLADAIYEILQNAAQHHDDTPHIEVTLTQRDGGSLDIEIIDDGPGIPDIEQETLASGHETSLTHSQGLGLWIVRTLIDRLGGTLTLSNVEPTGTSVRISLPVN